MKDDLPLKKNINIISSAGIQTSNLILLTLNLLFYCLH